MSQPSLESFLKDVANHKLAVLMDNGVYRHLRFKQPDSGNMRFDLITGPGYLLYRGDMGCYEFERLHDMFDFFRSTNAANETELKINDSYWAEKCEAHSRFGNGITAFCMDSFTEFVKEKSREYAQEEGFTGDRLTEFMESSEGICRYVENEYDAFRHISNFEFEGNDISQSVFGDSCDLSFKSFTYHYIWCCFAITWGIFQYDKGKS